MYKKGIQAFMAFQHITMKLDFSNRSECKVVALLIAAAWLVYPPYKGVHIGLVLTGLEADCAFVCCRYARIDFNWDLAGLIDVVARFVAIPDITLKSSSSSIDQTVLAAFVLLVLLTAAQAGLLIYSVLHGTRASTSVWTMIQASVLQTQLTCICTLCTVQWLLCCLVVADALHALCRASQHVRPQVLCC